MDCRRERFQRKMAVIEEITDSSRKLSTEEYNNLSEEARKEYDTVQAAREKAEQDGIRESFSVTRVALHVPFQKSPKSSNPST